MTPRHDYLAEPRWLAERNARAQFRASNTELVVQWACFVTSCIGIVVLLVI